VRRPLALLAALAVALAPAGAGAAPNDPGWPQQWHLRRIGVERAWTVTRGSGAVVAVVDTGVDATHPDLRGRLVDGYNAIDGGSWQDDNGHGTFMAGIIAAVTGNGLGVASVAPLARIMPIKALGADGSGNVDDVVRGIRWAVDHGADVINLSLAEESLGGGGGTIGNLLADRRLRAAISDAARRGALVVVAAGNDFEAGGHPQTAYDATDPGVLVVGASTSDDRRAAYSNYGSGLDLLAPGGGSATDPSAGDACQKNDPVVSTWWNPKTRQSAYGKGCGTSMAVAHVSGAGALLVALGLSNRQAAERILATARDLGPPGVDPETGHGRLDAAAVVAASAPPVPRTSSPRPSPRRTSSPAPVAAAGTPRPGPRPTPTPSPSSAPSSPIVAAPPPVRDERGARGPVVGAAGALMALTATGHLWARRRLRRVTDG
jgi:serine protease